jgi:hypothetical protein
MATGGALSSVLCCLNMGTRRTLSQAQDHEREHRNDTGALVRVDLPRERKWQKHYLKGVSPKAG